MPLVITLPECELNQLTRWYKKALQMVWEQFHLCADWNVRIGKGLFSCLKWNLEWREPKPNFKWENWKAQFIQNDSVLHVTWILCSRYVLFGTFIICSFCLSDFIRWGFGDNTEKIRLNFQLRSIFNTLITQKGDTNHKMQEQLLRQ